MEKVLVTQVKTEWVPFMETESDENQEVNDFFKRMLPQGDGKHGWYLFCYQIQDIGLKKYKQIKLTYHSYDKH